MTRVLLGVRGLATQEAVERVINALKTIKGVADIVNPHPGQLEVNFDPTQATVMDLLRAVRSQGFLAGML